MKNFPDQNQFHELVKRLQSYTEEPDETTWKNIDAALRPNRTPLWIPWVDRVTSMLAVLAFAFLFAGIPSNDKSHSIAAAKKNESTTAPGKTNDFHAEQEELKMEIRPYTENMENLSRAFVAKAELVNANSQQAQSIIKIQTVHDFADSIDQAQSIRILNEPHGFDSIFTSSLKMEPDSSSLNSTDIHETKRLRKRKLTFYAHVTPMLSFQRATPASRDGVIVTRLFDRSIFSTERFAISLDAGVQGFITKRFEYYGGLSLYRQNQTLRYAYQSGDQVSVESTGDKSYTVTPKPSTGIVNYDMMNVGAHAGILYYLYGKTLVHKVGTGISYQRGFRKSNSEAYKNTESSYLSYQVFYRNEVSVSRRLRVFIQPTFTYSVRVRETLDAPFTLKPYTAGIGFGVLYDF